MGYSIIADMHMHTIASSHAYGTVKEMAEAAQSAGLCAIAITDHGPGMEDAPHPWHFDNMTTLPREIAGVRVFRGIEANILNAAGETDLEDVRKERMEWVVASFHPPVAGLHMTEEECTNAWLGVIQNPHIDMMGHSGDPRYRYDYERVIREAAHSGTVVEINNGSFKVRAGSYENCKTIALLCKKYGAYISVDSDAHTPWRVAALDEALQMLNEVNFPSELIVNADFNRLLKYMENRRK
ncbi:MAG: phosphatase [Clostridia bacterium]|nr:phosphatase [Clostridia bacterium]